MARVVSLHGFEIASPSEPDSDVIEFLEDTLARARAGEIIALMAVTCNADGSVGQASLGTSLSTLSMVGQLERLKYRAIKDIEED